MSTKAEITLEWMRSRGADVAFQAAVLEAFGERATVAEVAQALQESLLWDWQGWLLGQDAEVTEAALAARTPFTQPALDKGLALALAAGRREVAMLLAEAGASMTAAYMAVLLHLVVRQRNVEAVRLLLDLGASPGAAPLEARQGWLDEEDERGEIARLLKAAEK